MVLVTAAATGTLERWGVVVLWYCVPRGTDEEKRGAELGSPWASWWRFERCAGDNGGTGT